MSAVADDFLKSVMAGATGIETITARELQTKEFPPIQWIVEPLIPEGLTILAGKPKLGKSWMALDVALAVSIGGVAFGNIDCEGGSVLYAALEDNQRRLQGRISQLLAEDADWPDRLKFALEMPRLTDGGMDEIVAWADSADNPRLVIIDTLAKVRPLRKGSDNNYDSDYAALEQLQKLAGERGIGVMVVHHVRKMDADDPLDTVSGTTGLTGCADSILVLARDSQGVALYGRGRDMSDIEKAVQLDQKSGRWSILGEADDVRRSDERSQILEALHEEGVPMGPRDIAKAKGLPEDSVRHLVLRMVEAGDIDKRGYGKYAPL